MLCASSERVIVNLSSHRRADWDWLGPCFPEGEFSWRSYSEHPRSTLERRVQRPRLSRYRAVCRGLWDARRENAAVLVTHGPRIAAAAGTLYQSMGLKMPHLAMAFTMTGLPGRAGRRYIARAVSRVDRFVCFSSIERERYSELFDIPAEKIDIWRWAVREPAYDFSTAPIESGEYICAIGGEGRDVPTLLAAMEKLPDLKLLLVTRPANVEGLKIPSNVDLRTNIPFEDVWNITHHARLHALPLVTCDMPAGHGTLIMAMQLRTPSVVTRSRAMTDYVEDQETALECEPQDPDSLAEKIRQLWDDQQLADHITASGRRFAIEECSEQRTYSQFRHYLMEHGLLDEDSFH